MECAETVEARVAKSVRNKAKTAIKRRKKYKKNYSKVWEQDAAGSNPVTRTTFLGKTAYLGGFSAFLITFSKLYP